MKKELVLNNESLGIVGMPTNLYLDGVQLRIGDVVNGEFVVSDEEGSFVMGYKMATLEGIKQNPYDLELEKRASEIEIGEMRSVLECVEFEEWVDFETAFQDVKKNNSVYVSENFEQKMYQRSTFVNGMQLVIEQIENETQFMVLEGVRWKKVENAE